MPGITTADAETLAEALGDLPLALAQAAAFLAGTRMPVAGYTQLLKERAAALLSKGKGGPGRPGGGVADLGLVTPGAPVQPGRRGPQV